MYIYNISNIYKCSLILYLKIFFLFSIFFNIIIIIIIIETSAAATQTSNIPIAKQPEPMFVAVPPRPSRVLHSDAYLR